MLSFDRLDHILYRAASVVLLLGFWTGVCRPEAFVLSRWQGKPDPIYTVQEVSDIKPPPHPAKRPHTPKMELTTGLGVRCDRLDWNIAGQRDGSNPNILSELSWDNLKIREISAGVRTTFSSNVYLQGSMNFGLIVEGENQDSDYGADDRQGEFSRSNNSADEGYTFDTSAGIGYVFRFDSNRLTFIPMTGLSYHCQSLTMTDGYQTINTDDPSLVGPIDGLDSSYDTQWFGPWIGFSLGRSFNINKRFLQRISPEGVVTYHWADYYAVADWNLRSDFEHPKSFEHEAWGSGFRIRLGLRFEFTDNWSLGFGYMQQAWRAVNGVDRVFLSQGGTSETRLNEVNWESRSVGLECVYRF
jgi:hypothetical protein